MIYQGRFLINKGYGDQMKFLNKIFFIFFVLCPVLCFAQDDPSYESIEQLKEIAKNYLTKNIQLEQDETMDIQINGADLPSQLVKCSQPVEPLLPRGTSREKIGSVELICNGEKSWHIYLPVMLNIYTKVVISRSPIMADSVISESELDYMQANINHLFQGYFKDKNEILGYVASQTINPGAVITKKSIKRPQLVHKNQEIDLIARKNFIQVMMKGVAKSDGGLNDLIIAYNPSSKKMVEAVVTGLNKAEVRF